MGLPASPDYSGPALVNLLPAVAARLGVGDADDRFDLPAADRYVVYLVDGMGWDAVTAAPAELPTLTRLMATATELASVVPSTTAAAITSLGTGLPPGRHGLVGYRFWDPALGQHVGPLKWETTAVPEAYQPIPTLLDRAGSAGVNVTRVVPRDHVDSGFSRAALRGPAAVGVAEDDAAAWAAAVARVLGDEDGLFWPDDPITREQFVTIMHRYALWRGDEASGGADLGAFEDAGEASEWALPALRWAVATGLVQGRSDTELAPAGEVTRAETAAILARFIES